MKSMKRYDSQENELETNEKVYKYGSIQKSVGIHNKTKQIGDDEIKGSIL